MMQVYNKNLLFCIIFFIAVEGIFFNITNSKITNDFKNEELRISKVQNLLESTPIIAKSYSIYDITTGRKIYGKNDNVPMPLASLAKTMAISVALSDYKQTDEVSISRNAIKQEGDFGIFENEKWNIYDLAKLTLICSANDGVYAITEKNPNYLKKMNDKARRLGMNNATFFNYTGLDINESMAGAYASAEDANLMASYALKSNPDVFNATTLREIILKSNSGFTHNVKNTDIILDKIPNVLFSKTGYTGLAGGNLTIIFKDTEGHNIAITVLGSTFSGRFIDMEKLVNVLELSYTK
jgi:D-alanyl-D-alanine carboxypeptidase